MEKPKFNPNAPFEVIEAKPKFNPDAPFEVVGEKEKPSVLESFARQAGGGATLGFDDELGGVLGGLGRVAGVKNLASWKPFDEKSTLEFDSPTVNIEKLKEAYLRNRDELRKDQRSDYDANPMSSFVGNMAGSMATGKFIPGTSAALNPATTLGTKIGIGAAQGTVTGFGMAEGDASDQLMSTAMGGAIGGAAPVVMKGIGKGIEKTGELINPVLKKTGKALFGVDEKATDLYLKNRDVINRAASVDDVADDFLNKSLPKMKEATSEYSSEAWNTLNPNAGFEKSDVLQAIVDRQKELAPRGFAVGAADNKALNQLGNLSDDISQFGKTISEPEAKHIIQSLDHNINWNNPEAKVSNESLKTVREFIDNNLKEQNPLYKSVMEETAESVRDLKAVERMFVNRRSPDSHQKFVNAVKNLGTKDEASDLARGLDLIKKQTGDDIRENVMNSWAKSQFQKGDTNGSRKTILGGIIGEGIGSRLGIPYIGGIIGAGAWHVADRYAGPIFKKILDGKITSTEKILPLMGKILPLMGKFGKPFSDAMARGPAAVSAFHFIMQNNPEYRELVRKIEGEDGQ